MLPVLVAGGGIGGLAAALALSRAGIPVRLFERAPEFRDTGAGIQLGPNAFHMLDRLGLHAAVDAAAVRPEAVVMRCAVGGQEIARLPLGGMQARFGNPYAVIHRAELHRALLQACAAQWNIALETGRSVIVFIEDPEGVTIRLEDGESVRGSGLIGADGLWSRTRQVVVGDGRPASAGHIAYRAVVPMASLPEGMREPGVAIWAGPRLHLTHYPLQGGEAMNLVAVFQSEHYVEGWDQAADPRLLWRHFAGARPELQEMLSRIETWRSWVLCDRDPQRGWTRGHVTLLGDAAHPTLQYLAQGASMALEDAVCLADQLVLREGDAARAFADYEALRVLRTGRVQSTARLFGEICHAGGVRAELRDGWLAGYDAAALRESLAWLYERPRWPGDA